MIVGVRGTLETAGPDWVHLQVGGVTLQVFVPSAVIGQLGEVGAPVSLFTQLRVRDDQPVLYGFSTTSALGLFSLLLGVSGVGPRLSLALLSNLGEGGLYRAIEEGDVGALSGVSGVGRRIASRIILELKGKLELEPDLATAQATNDDVEVIAALSALGYSTTEARRALNGLDKSVELTLEDKLRQVLQQMAGS